jgi:hypothetical protein
MDGTDRTGSPAEPYCGRCGARKEAVTAAGEDERGPYTSTVWYCPRCAPVQKSRGGPPVRRDRYGHEVLEKARGAA